MQSALVLLEIEPSPFARFIMILMALTKIMIVTRPSVKSKSVASCSGYEIGCYSEGRGAPQRFPWFLQMREPLGCMRYFPLYESEGFRCRVQDLDLNSKIHFTYFKQTYITVFQEIQKSHRKFQSLERNCWILLNYIDWYKNMVALKRYLS